MIRNIGFFGKGIVGKALMSALGVEKFIDKDTQSIDLVQMSQCRFIFICVPTPPFVKGSCDISIVEDCIANVTKYQQENIYIIKSTVTPGVADYLMDKYKVPIISCPEFLTEKTAMEDAKNPDIIVIGSSPEYREETLEVVELLRNNLNYQKLIRTNNRTAEFIKYAVNTFYFLKVIFANELYNVCQNIDIEYDAVRNSLYSRKWIGKNHLKVLFNGKRGVRGRCLPKDMEAFQSLYDSPLLRVAQEVNESLIGDDKDGGN